MLNMRDFIGFTKELFKKITPSQTTFGFSAVVFNEIHQAIHAPSKIADKTKVQHVHTFAGKNFKIPNSVSSMPMSTDIGENNKIRLTTVEPALKPGTTELAILPRKSTNRTKDASTTSSTDGQYMKGKGVEPVNAQKFKNEIPKINKAAFSNGLDLDNFRVANISTSPLSRDVLKELTKAGGILPLNSKYGIFIPNSAIKNATLCSMEYETNYVMRPYLDKDDFDAVVRSSTPSARVPNPPNLITSLATKIKTIGLNAKDSPTGNPGDFSEVNETVLKRLKEGTTSNDEFYKKIDAHMKTLPGVDARNFESMIAEPAKRLFNIDPTALLTHAAGGSFSYRTCSDCSLPVHAGNKKLFSREIVIGAAPLTNLIYATHISLAAIDAQGGIRPEDRVLDKSFGVHVSTTLGCLHDAPVPDPYNRTPQPYVLNTASNYLNHVGLITDALSRNRTRWESTSHLGVAQRYDGNRNDFRIESNKQRLECRFFGGAWDIGTLSDSMIMAHKINSDIEDYVAHVGPQLIKNVLPSANSYVTVGGGKGASVMSVLHDPTNPGHAAMRDWFDKFTDIIGIHNPVEKEVMVNMNKKCLNTVNPATLQREQQNRY